MQIKDYLFRGDCLDFFPHVTGGVVDLAFADPPFNIGFDYGDGEYDDKLPAGEYEGWSEMWMRQVYRILKPNGTFWLAIGDEWVADLRVLARKIGFHLRSWVIWHYTFGVQCERKFARSHTHLLYFTKHKSDFTFNVSDVRVPSARQLVYNDKRANPAGKLPDDTWILRPQDLADGFPADGDIWFVPRICGTFKQRQLGAANQMPEQLLARVIRACSNEGQTIFDPMAGTGTTLAVAKKLNRRYLGCELSARFAELIEKRISGVKAGDALD